MIIFKSLWRQKPLLKSQKYRTCYAGRGLRSGTPRWGYPSHRYRGGPLPFTKPWAATPLRRPLPASHVWMVNISVPSHANMTLTWIKKWQMIPRQITMSLDKRDCACGTSQHETYETFCRRDKALWFSTLLTTAIRRYVLIIRKLSY